jgi:hypothetical protein
MLQVASALKGCSLEVNDGTIGTVQDFLFDDTTWRVRWLVVDTGSWLPGRKVLIHPSAIQASNLAEKTIRVDLSKAQVKASPDILSDEPVSGQNEDDLYGYYGWDPRWDTGVVGGGGFRFSPVMRSGVGEAMLREPPAIKRARDEADQHLRSIAAVTGYHVRATDGRIGHVENFLLDEGDWGVRYLIIDTRNWWAGKEVLISPYAITKIEWLQREILLDAARDQVKSSPPWAPFDNIDRSYEEQLHKHYGWPGYGW